MAEIGNIVPLLTADAISLAVGFLNAPWGIYNGIVPVVLADNVVAFNYKQEFAVSDYPVEQGQFASFNKVFRPFLSVFRFTAGGSLIKRQAILDSIAAIIGDLNLYNIVTADATYTGVNLVSYTYTQTATDGVGLIKVDVTVQQIKTPDETAEANLIPHPIDPGASATVSGGVIQPIDATPTQVATLPSIIQ